MVVELAEREQRIAQLAEELRASGAIGRSDSSNRLFDFLLAQTLAGRSPKEIEVASEVFGKDGHYDVVQDASVRVQIHRLRKKLDEVYAGRAGERLTIPRGEYRLAIETAEGPAVEEGAPPQPAADPTPTAEPSLRRLAHSRWTLAAIALALIAGLAIGWFARSPRFTVARSPLASTSLWQPLAGTRRPTFMVAGDYYIFGEAPNSVEVTRLVREFAINSREDLDDYLMSHPDDYGRFVDLDLHYLPISFGYVMRDVLPVVNDLAAASSLGRPWVIPMSRLTPEALKGSNIVYVGFLSGLGLLRDPLFEASGFTVGASYDELIDRKSGKHYISDWEQKNGDRSPRRDFAYLATFPGPAGNQIVVISGTRDAAVAQASEIAVDKAQLDQIAARTKGAASFEALYEVRTLGTLNLGSRLVLARPLKLDGLWRPGASPGNFPDQMPQPDGTPATATP